MDRQREPGEKKDPAPRSNGKEPEQSISSRIVASASGLAKDFLGGASAEEAQSAFASGSGLSRKVQNGAGAAGSSSWSQTLPSKQNGSSSHASVGSGETFRSQEGFREANASEQAPDFDFDAFLSTEGPTNLNSEDSFQFPTRWSTEFHNGDSFSSHSHDRPQATQEQSNGFHGQYEQLESAHNNSHVHDDYDDGAEVRLLLSDPTFSIDDPMDMQMADPTPESVNELFNQKYTAEEKEIVDKIKSTLPPPPQHNGVSPDNPLNLRPEFASLTASNPQLEQGIRELSSTLGSGIDGIMTFNDAQRQHWLAEWDNVLNSYTEEVWGEMLPVVKEARSQLEEAKTGMDRLDNKAVARLRMILGHVVDTNQTISTASFIGQAQSAAQQQALDSGMQDLRQLHHPMHQQNSTNKHEYAVQPSPHQQSMQEDRHMQREEQKSQDGQDWEAPTFHCPYVSCHEQFRNEAELRMHSNQHQGFSCPHSDCADRFENSTEWADHINRSHHGLVAPRPEDEDLGV
ncbi:Zinc finger C2H2-type protein [Botryosphaeria dothidea]|uniref:Zinc finger C2H2-type protein n=1 Tax=Botryosphaeria dothidea TaxID=55169 RepID=A0A8H4J139_9PEZI|nr:Zinc finger C2H2-type protein [Botryosphaeria dothidea]